MEFTGSRQVRRWMDRQLDKEIRYKKTGFKAREFIASDAVSNSKYMPHIGKKEIGRYAD